MLGRTRSCREPYLLLCWPGPWRWAQEGGRRSGGSPAAGKGAPCGGPAGAVRAEQAVRPPHPARRLRPTMPPPLATATDETKLGAPPDRAHHGTWAPEGALRMRG